MNLNRLKSHNIFFLIVALVITILFFYLFYPYINIFVLAVIFALIISPLNKYLIDKLKVSKISATILSIVIAALIVFIPVYLTIFALITDTINVIRSIQDNIDSTYLDNIIVDYNDLLNQYNLNDFQVNKFELSNSLRDLVSTFSSSLVNTFNFVLRTSYNSIVNIFMFFLFSIALVYYWDLFKKYIVDITPLDDEVKNIYYKRLNLITWDVIKGTLILAVIQGFTAGIFLYFVGVPNAFLWSFLVMVFSIVPILGTSIIMVPIGVFYILSGSIFLGIGILLWQIFVVGTIDNVIRPFIVSEEIKINPIVLLFAFLAGVSTFGPLGIFYGPIIVILFLTTLEIISKIYFDKDINFFRKKSKVKVKREGVYKKHPVLKVFQKLHKNN